MTILYKLSGLMTLLAVFIVFIVSTDPYKLPLPLVVVPFLLLAVIVYQGSSFTLAKSPLRGRRPRLVAGMVTSIILLLVLLQSIRQLSVKDFLILGALLVGLLLYLRRLDL